MKTKNLILIMLSFTVFLFADVPARGQNKSGTGTIKGDTVIYTCPMHPEIQSKQPGNCPKCGMKLIEKSTKSGKEVKRHKMSSMGIGMGLVMTGMLVYMIAR